MTARLPLRVVVGSIAVGVLAAAFRLPDVAVWVNTDAFRWYDRTVAFWDALATRRWGETFQHHPGVTLMWLSGASMRLAGTFGTGVTPATIQAAVLPIALVGSMLPTATALLLAVLFGRTHHGTALLAGGLLATEPFLVAHARSLHLDMLVTAFAWCGVLAVGVALRRHSSGWAVAAGALLGLALLTKAFAGAVVAGAGLWCAGVALVGRDARPLRVLALVAGTATVLAFILWPALLTDPIVTLTRLRDEIGREVAHGHQNFLLGTIYPSDPGALFYAVVALFRTSPEVLAASVLGLGVALARRGPVRPTVIGLLLAYLPALLLVLASPKKGERYFLPFLPLLVTLAALGVSWLLRGLARTLGAPHRHPARAAIASAVVAVLVARAARLVAVHPHPLAWCSPVPGLRCEQAMTLGWGEGMAEAAAWIHAAAPDRATLVFGGTYGDCMTPFARVVRVGPGEAEFIVRYLSDDQRLRWVVETDPWVRGAVPLHEVWLGGRRYAAIYAGPRHASRRDAAGKTP